MNNDFPPTEAECRAERLCACVLSQVQVWSRGILRMAADPRHAPVTGRAETQDGLHRWSICPLPIPQHGIMGMMVRMNIAVPMSLCEYKDEKADPPPLPAELLSPVARRMVSWLRHPQFAEDVMRTWQRVARTAQPMGYHVSCDPDGYAYAVSIRSVPAQGKKKGADAIELLVMNRLHECWCAEALPEEDGERKPHFRPDSEKLYYRPCVLSGWE